VPKAAPPRVVDIFSGAGGLSEGFRQAGCSILAGTDIDPDACATYALNFPEAIALHSDVRQPAARRRFLAAASHAEIVVGGPPCQSFSQVRNGAKLITDPRNSLYREFVKIVSELQPRAFVMENVPGLEQMGAKAQVVSDLSLRGAYRVRAHVLDAADFGVPQTRRRLVFIGVHRSLAVEPPVLAGTGATQAVALARTVRRGRTRYEPAEDQPAIGGPLLDRLLDPEDETLVTAEQALGDLAILRAGERQDAIEPALLKPSSSAYQRRMRAALAGPLRNTSVPRVNDDTVLRLLSLPSGGNYRDLPEKMRKRYLTGALWGPHNGSGQLGRRHYYAYRKLHPRIWSWTLNTKADAVYHYEEARALSVREFARLQSFPDTFVFTTDPRRGDLRGRIEGGAGHSRYRQVGNAVPPILARAIALALLRALKYPLPA
jgi:DNA (cytosine-5)-methyltransferase 1